ncbi:MAG: hypothetical protein U0842_18940 [Candidatus Binatia bacterium]
MNAIEWIELLMLSGLAGAIGQIARVVVGIKKLGQEAAAVGKTRTDLIEVSRLVISIVIGFTAGALAAMLVKVDLEHISVDQLLAFAAAGYAGADFIEGAMDSVTPKLPPGGSVAGDSAPRPSSTTQAAQSATVADDYVG